MVRYLGINYLNEAVAARRQLLSRCLLSVPQHSDRPDVEQLLDDRYRLPWTRVKAEKELLKSEAKKVAAAVGDLMQLSEIDGLKTEAFSCDLYTTLDCEVVPSSNPDSPELFPLDHPLPVSLSTLHIITDSFQLEDVKQYQTVNDDYRLEILSGEDYLSETRKKLPSVFTLKGRLRPLQVRDPLIQDKNYWKADLTFSEQMVVPMLNQKYEDSSIDEKFESQLPVYNNMVKGELENVITPPCSQILTDGTAERAKLSKSVMSIEEISVEPEPRVAEIVETTFCLQEYTTKLEPLGGSPIASVLPSFLDINDIITEDDIFCENAFLPVPADDYLEKDLVSNLQMPKLNKIPLTDKDGRICLLTETKKQILKDQSFASERYCDEIQASRIPEPAIDVVETFPIDGSLKDNPINKAREILDMKPCSNIGQTELSLPWGIIKLGNDIKDTSKKLDQLVMEGVCETVVKDVEVTEKYSNAEIYDWRDPLISLNDPSSSKKDSKPSMTTTSFCAVGNNPLDDFMALRMNMISASNRQIENSEPHVAPDTNRKLSVKDLKSAQQGRKRSKHHVVVVKLSDDFLQVLEVLSDKANYMIQALKLSGDLSKSSCFESLTPDMTRFLLKQKEKQMQDSQCDADETYRNIVGLHALSGAADIVANCCLESGIAYINALQEKYSDILKGLLIDVRQKLFETKAMFYKRQVHHPKIVALCKEVETWLKKKRAKSGDNEQKILVLIKRDLPSLLKSLKTVLSLGQLLIPGIIESSSSEEIIKSLDKHNCLLAYIGLVDDNFPWAQFCLVVEYEDQSDSVWKHHCERQNIRHIALKLDNDSQQEHATDAGWGIGNSGTQITLIASQNITKNIQLLQMLESRHNILLVERDYSLIEGCRQLHFPDVDIDEDAGIVVFPLIELKDDCSVQTLVTKIVALSLKLMSCWILLYTDKPNCYEFPGVVVTNLSRLEAAIANMTFKKDDFDVKLLIYSDLAEIADSIRSISEYRMTANKNSEIWLKRDWLTEDASPAEKFLMMLPPITSFNAQLILTSLSLKELFSLELVELTAVLPRVPEKVLTMLVTVANNEYGLHLQDDRSTLRKDTCMEESASSDFEVETEETDQESAQIFIDHLEINGYVRNTELTFIGGNERNLNLDDRKCLQRPSWTELQEAHKNNDSCNAENITETVEETKVPDMDQNATQKYDYIETEGYKLSRKVDRHLNHVDSVCHVKKTQICNDVASVRSRKLENRSNSKKAQSVETNAVRVSVHSAINKSYEKFTKPVNESLDEQFTDSLVQDTEKAGQLNELRGKTSSTNIGDYKPTYNNPVRNQYQLKTKQETNEEFTDFNRSGKESVQGKKTPDATQRSCIDIYRDASIRARRRLSDDFKDDYSSDGPNKDRFNYYNRYHVIEEVPRDEIGKYAIRKDTDDENRYNAGFSPAEIERLLQEDLDNYAKSRFADCRKIPLQNKATVQNMVANNSSRKLNENEIAQDKANNGLEAFEIDPTGDLQRNINFEKRELCKTMKLRELASVPQLSSKSIRQGDFRLPSNDLSLSCEVLTTPSDEGNFKYSMGQNVDPDQTRRLRTEQTEFYIDKNKTWSNDILALRKNELTIPQLLGKDPLELLRMNRKAENFSFRPAEQLCESKIQKGDGNFERLQKENNRSFERNDLTFQNKTFSLSTKIDLEPDFERSLMSDLRTERRENNIAKPEENRQLPQNLKQTAVDFIENARGLYINPNAERLTQRPKFVNQPSKPAAEDKPERSLADDLRETTRKVLANSQQFSRFSSTSQRRPMQKLNIGLAVPLHRGQMSKSLSGHTNMVTGTSHSRNMNKDTNKNPVRLNTGDRPRPGINTEPLSTRQKAGLNDRVSFDSNDSQVHVNEEIRTRNRVENSDNIQHIHQLSKNRQEPEINTIPGSSAMPQPGSNDRRQRMQQRMFEEQKALMMQSPWANDDSPPMDLDYEEFTQTDLASTNRAIFTSQTPLKKRKLTYQAVPGRKGQTRLVFQ